MSKKSKPTLSKFYMDCMILARDKKWRYGQAVFNHLLDVWPEKAEEVRGTLIDVFYMIGPADDFEKWDKFAIFIEKDWHN